MHIDIDVIKEILLSLNEKRDLMLPPTSNLLVAFNADLLNKHGVIEAKIHFDTDHGEKTADAALLIKILSPGRKLLVALEEPSTLLKIKSGLAEYENLKSFNIFLGVLDRVLSSV